MTDLEYKTACAWSHIKQAGSTILKRTDPLWSGFQALKKQGKITIANGVATLSGEYRRAFLAGDDVPDNIP